MNPENPEGFSSPEVKTIKLVPVEDLIPDIKPSAHEPEKGIDYRTNEFEDSFIKEFFREFVKIINTEEQREDAFEDFFILKDRFKDKIVVDLGSGPEGRGYYLSALLGARGYIGVEKFHGDILEKNLAEITLDNFKSWWEDFFKNHKGSGGNPNYYGNGDFALNESTTLPKAHVAKEDILNFLRRLPDRSVSMFMFGIDAFVIPDDKYRDLLAREIERVIDPQGGYLEDNGLRPTKLKNLIEAVNDSGEAIDLGVQISPFLLESNDSPTLRIKAEDIERSVKKYNTDFDAFKKKT